MRSMTSGKNVIILINERRSKMSLSRTKRPWVLNRDGTQGYVWNPTPKIRGIPEGALNQGEGGEKNIDKGPKRILDPGKLMESFKLKKPSRLLTCPSTDLFSPYNRPSWIGEIIVLMSNNPRHDFIVVTSFAKSLLKWERFIPENTWLGAKVSRQEEVDNVFWLRMVNAKVRFVLFEYLKGPIKLNLDNLNWIVFSENSRCNPSSIEYIQPLIDQAKRLKIPIFLDEIVTWHERIQKLPRT